MACALLAARGAGSRRHRRACAGMKARARLASQARTRRRSTIAVTALLAVGGHGQVASFGNHLLQVDQLHTLSREGG